VSVRNRAFSEKKFGVTSAEQGGGKERSDFVGVNLDDALTAILPPPVTRRISHRADLGTHLFAGESCGNGVPDFWQLAPHNMAARTSIFAMNMQRVERSHRNAIPELSLRSEVAPAIFGAGVSGKDGPGPAVGV